MRCIRCDPNRSRRFDPGRKAVASTGEIEGVVPDEVSPAFCGSVAAFNDGIPIAEEESLAPFLLRFLLQEIVRDLINSTLDLRR